MNMVTGLFDGMVLQRTARIGSDAIFSGTTKYSGCVRGRVRCGSRAVRGFENVPLGRAGKGRLSGRIKGLPVGGPYMVELQVVGNTGAVLDSLRLSDVWVGDVWIAAGQSNMQGYGKKCTVPAPVPQVRGFYMDDRWAAAREPLHNMWACVDQVHVNLCGARPPAPRDELTLDGCMGPGIPFVRRMWECTGVPQGVLACAHGGTGMGQWDPTLKPHSLYGATIRRVRKNGGRVAGMIWYQGCSETSAEAVPVYVARMKKLVAALRRDCSDARLPVAIVQLSRVVGEVETSHWDSIRDLQRKLAEMIPHLACVPAVDATFSDPIHIDGRSAVSVGERLADAMLHLTGDREHGRAPMALKSWRLDKGNQVIVEFDHVAGRLRAGSRPMGFDVFNRAGINVGFDTILDGNRVVIHCSPMWCDTDGATVSYAHGLNPCCNVEDESGWPVPAFGPVLLGPPRYLTPFIRALRVSECGRLKGTIRNLPYPGKGLAMTEESFGGEMCTIVCPFGRFAAGGSLVYASFNLKTPAFMRLALHLGYDGPVKVWVNRREVFCDPKGAMPCSPDDARVPFAVRAGTHEVMIALAANPNETWGVFLRVERVAPFDPNRAPPSLPSVV